MIYAQAKIDKSLEEAERWLKHSIVNILPFRNVIQSAWIWKRDAGFKPMVDTFACCPQLLEPLPHTFTSII